MTSDNFEITQIEKGEKIIINNVLHVVDVYRFQSMEGTPPEAWIWMQGQCGSRENPNFQKADYSYH